jgi:hypothetical protein
MATSPMPNPQASAPPPTGGAGAASGGDNPLKSLLGKLIQVLSPMSQQNPAIQEDLGNAIRSLAQAYQKIDQNASGPAQQPAAPPQQ